MSRPIKILAVLAVILFCLLAFGDNKAEVDLWGNAGFVAAFPWQDGFKHLNTFSFTEPDSPWINHEWLGEYLLHFVFIHFGSTGLLLFKLFLGLCLAGILYWAMRKATVSGPVIFLLLILTISTVGYGMSPRPHLFTYILYASLLLILRQHKGPGPGSLLLLPFFGIIWANIHGAFFIGAVILALYSILRWLDKKTFPKTELLFTALFILATFVNPYGPRLWSYIFYSASIPRPYLSEWAPFTDPAYIVEHIDFVVLAASSLAAIFFSRKNKEMAWPAILSVSLIGALCMRRNIPLFAITAAFVVPQRLEDVAGKKVDELLKKFSPIAIAAALSVFALFSLVYALTFNKADPLKIEVQQSRFPANTVDFMKENGVSGNALVFFDWGEYCIWKLYPRCKVFLDGRFCCAYSVKTIDDFFGFLYMQKNWENALKDYPTDIVLIHKGNPACAAMLRMPGWEFVYEDKIAALFMKRSAHKEFLSRLDKGDTRTPDVRNTEYFP